MGSAATSSTINTYWCLCIQVQCVKAAVQHVHTACHIWRFSLREAFDEFYNGDSAILIIISVRSLMLAVLLLAKS